MSAAEQLACGIAALGLNTPAASQRKLLDYIELIARWNRVHNLTAIRDPLQMVSHHLLDSLAVVPHVAAQQVLDVGSGAGLPGIPLAIQWPQAQVTLLDANHKKAAFMRQALIELGINNAVVICERIENWRPTRAFELVITRAFSAINKFVAQAGHTCLPGGMLAAMKGTDPAAELAQLPPEFRVRKIVPLAVPGLDAERHLVIIEHRG